MAFKNWFFGRKTSGGVTKTSAVSPATLTGAAAALLIAIPFIADREGESLVAYQDVGKVWTICNGETEGVRPSDRMTPEQCRALTQSRVGQFMGKVDALLQPDVPPATLAAHTSFAYNVGINGYAKSQTLKLSNTGDIMAGCDAMMNWYTAGGRDCRVRGNGCYGLVLRRQDEVKLCKGALP